MRTNHTHSAGSVQGGAVLSGEDSLDGALREVNEELGLFLIRKTGGEFFGFAGNKHGICMMYGYFI
ncbi:NUDIX domain-containing protein [Hungatella sp.]|uniref:NUDIX domain-containing protein n=1 Tax=Hungatella sp. TaxID=2613924 RepID=UPI0039A39C8B